MKITDKHIFLLFLVLGVGLFLVVYFLPIKNIDEESDKLKTDNSKLVAEVGELQVYHDNRSQYESDTELLKNEIVNTVAAFPSMYRPEDYILEGVAMQTASPEMVYDSINIQKSESVALIPGDRLNKAGLDKYNNGLDFTFQTVDYNNDITYLELKNALAQAFSSKHRLNINNITYKRDKSTGDLKGVISLGYYYVIGNGVEYVAPSIPEYTAGTYDIFNGGWNYIGNGYFVKQTETAGQTE